MKKITKQLISCEPKQYPDKTITFKEVTKIDEYVKRLVDKGVEPFDALKNVPVKARLGQVGEKIISQPKVEYNGKLYIISETENEVKVEGSMVVTNPDGEEYIVKPDAFAKKYKKLEDGMYEPIATPIIAIEIDENITFTAPWGEVMFAPKGSILNVTDLNSVYSITNTAFNATYQEIDELKV